MAFLSACSSANVRSWMLYSFLLSLSTYIFFRFKDAAPSVDSNFNRYLYNFMAFDGAAGYHKMATNSFAISLVDVSFSLSFIFCNKFLMVLGAMPSLADISL